MVREQRYVSSEFGLSPEFARRREVTRWSLECLFEFCHCDRPALPDGELIHLIAPRRGSRLFGTT